jgi:dihydroorotase
MGSEEDRVALLEALLDGTIDCIATDHAPHTDIEKDLPVNECPFGMIGLETAFPLMYTRLVKTGKMSLPFLIRRITSVPAEIIHVDPRGSLKIGAPADITLVDLNEEFEFTRESIHSKSKNSPFIGTKFFGRVKQTIVNGNVIFRNGQIVGD